MKKLGKKALAAVLALVMVANIALTYLPPLQTAAAPITKTMSHLVAGSSNGNGHFGSASPEAFVLSKKSVDAEKTISFTMKLGSETGDTRFRFVTKYQDDDNWAYVGLDPDGWIYEYKYQGNSSYGNVSELSTAAKGDILEVKGEYTDTGLKVTVKNVAQDKEESAVISNEKFLLASKLSGRIGYGAGAYSTGFTDVYVADTKVGQSDALGHGDFEAYEKSATGFIWATEDVQVGEDGQGSTEENPGGNAGGNEGEDTEVTGKKWIVLNGTSSTSGGHNYGSGSAGPMFYKDTSRTMTKGGSVSLTVKPSSNWGVFYSYIDDDCWVYVGYDSYSKWYYQYQFDGNSSYASISGLPEVKTGEEVRLSIGLSQETLIVSVNDTEMRTPKDAFISYVTAAKEKSNGNLGNIGIMSKVNEEIRFSDVVCFNEDCMDDSWTFAVDGRGTVTTENTAVRTVSGTVKNAEKEPLSEATVRVGTRSATTGADGTFKISGIEVGSYSLAVSKLGYQSYTQDIQVTEDGTNSFEVELQVKPKVDLGQYDTIASEKMTVYIGKKFPVVARYVMKSDETGKKFFRGNETALDTIVINGIEIKPSVEVKETTGSSRTYQLTVQKDTVNLVMDVKISVEKTNLTWEVTSLEKKDGCADIATIDIPHLNLLTVDATESESVFAGAKASKVTTKKADTYISFKEGGGFVPSNEDGYLYGFLSNGALSAGLHSNSEVEGDKRVERINGADTMSLTSAAWYYERGDQTGQSENYTYPKSELPIAKVAIADGDLNKDGDIDWNDGAIAFREVMHYAQDTEVIKDIVNYRIVMNFESAASNPFLTTADNVKKVYLATDGLPQALLLKGYGNEGHDSANSEYADISEREGGVKDFQSLIKIAHDYNTEVGIHINAQEAYPESRSFNETMVSNSDGILNDVGWGWLDQSVKINKLWDLSSNARLKRLVQLYDRINGTKFYSGDWDQKEYVKDSLGFFTNGDGITEVTRETVLKLIKADAANRPDNMDFIYLDVWYQNSWETRRIAEEFNSLGWRFSTEFSDEGEYDSTWQHWSTDAVYGDYEAKGYNSDIIRFLRNDQRDSQVLNYPKFGGTADNPLLGGYRLYGFEGWGGQQDFNEYIKGTFNENLPTKFLQHYEIIDWENYGDKVADETSPVGNTEKKITLAKGNDVVVVTRNEEQRADTEIERTITLNGKVVLNTDTTESTYLLPWTDNQTGEVKLYHWNLSGGTTQWQLQDDWKTLENVVVYELSDQGRINENKVAVNNGSITLTAKEATAYVVVKGEEAKTLKNDFGEYDYVVDPGFNGYADGDQLGSEWTGDTKADGVTVIVSDYGDQKLELSNTRSDVAVTTKISGLEAGKDYVAEVYVANESDAKAMLSVNTGSKTVSNYTMRSIARNYISSDPEHGSNMQRMQISFAAESETAYLTLSREAGEGYTLWDDIRIVDKKVDNFKEDGSFVQDFESVVQGLYPFVLGYDAGGDSRTHLSQDNGKYTSKGWNEKAVDDVIDGEWSLKHHVNRTGLIYRTIPQNFRFEAGKVYCVEFDYQTVSGGYQMVVGDGTTYTLPTDYLPTTDGKQHASLQVIGSGTGQTWFGLYMNGSLCGTDTSTGTVDFILDNLVIKEIEANEVVTVGERELFLGEMSEIYGKDLEKITWTMSKEGVVKVDQEINRIKAIGAGAVTVTATFPSGKTEEFSFVVTNGVPEDMDRSKYSGITAQGNTEESSGEGTGNGKAEHLVDGKSETYWHSQWSGDKFTISEDNPAVLTIDLGESIQIGGFKFQNRTSRSDRSVTLYDYEVWDAEGKKLTSGGNVEVSMASQEAGAWQVQVFDKNVTARKIVLKIKGTSATGNDIGTCAIAEFVPITVQRTAGADEILEVKTTFTDTTANPGTTSKIETEIITAEGYVAKGFEWASSDEMVATITASGTIQYHRSGLVTFTLRNAFGEYASHTVRVNAAPDSDKKDDDAAGNEKPNGGSGNSNNTGNSDNAGNSEQTGNTNGSGNSSSSHASGSTSSTGTGAKTGDSSSIMMWIVLLAMSVLVLAGSRKKRVR